MSEETAKKIDAEVKKIVDKGYERARKVLTEKIDDLHKIAKALLVYETLTGDEIRDLILKNIQPAKLTKKQEHAIHSLLDFLQRKCKISFDYQKYFKWVYFQMVNPTTHFVRCNFQRAIGIVRKIISKGDYKEPYGYKESVA